MNIHIAQPMHLAPFSVFDVGLNKPYINQGLIDKDSRTSLASNLTELHAQLQEEKQSKTLSFDADVIHFLAKEQPQLLTAYKKLFSEGQHELACQTYDGTTLSILGDSAEKSIIRHQQLMKQHFNKTPTTLLTTHTVDTTLLSKTNCTRNILHSSTYTPEDYLQKNLLKAPLQSELQDNLLDELHALSIHVHDTEDNELISLLYKLATPAVIKNIHPEEGETPYDHYTTVMSILQDMANRIKALQHIQKGIFVTEPQIQASPSQLLR